MKEFWTQLNALKMPIYVVFDGAIVDNIEGRLDAYGLNGRPIFRVQAKKETILAGPWLVHLVDQILFDRAMSASVEFGKSVFWVGECEEDGLLRHLRTLNAARMPDGRIVYFRHYDSDVLASVVTLVDAEQAARLFGPMTLIGLIGGRGDGATVLKPEDLPMSSGGLLSFKNWQIDELNQRQQNISRAKIAKMIRRVIPVKIVELKTDAQLVEALCDDCMNYGMHNESSHARWCCLHYWSSGLWNKEFIESVQGRNNKDDLLREYFKKKLNKTSEFDSVRGYFK